MALLSTSLGLAPEARAATTSDGSTCTGLGRLGIRSGPVKDAKTIVFNHGHDKARGEPCALVKQFVPEGYVVFAPLRRGHYSRVPDNPPAGWEYISSTGVYIDDFTDQCLARGCAGDCPSYQSQCNADALDVGYLREQARQEVADELAFVLGQPAVQSKGLLADPAHVALFGHSYGGSLTVAANSILQLHHNVAVAFSPGALSWNQTWREALSEHVRNAWKPLYVLQPRNEAAGQSVGPTRVLPAVGVEAGWVIQGSLFPDAPWTPCDPDAAGCENEGKQAHSAFIGDPGQVALWAPSAIEFMDRYRLRTGSIPPPAESPSRTRSERGRGRRTVVRPQGWAAAPILPRIPLAHERTRPVATSERRLR